MSQLEENYKQVNRIYSDAYWLCLASVAWVCVIDVRQPERLQESGTKGVEPLRNLIKLAFN
jgi:hypothetical protein